MTDARGLVEAAPATSHLATVEVVPGTPIDLGGGPDGRRRTIPIVGGRVTGPRLIGRVLAGGADWQVAVSDRVVRIDARQALELDDGTRIEMTSLGLRVAGAEDAERIAAGHPVDPAGVYFRTAVHLRAPEGSWSWLNERLFVGSGARLPDRVVIGLHEIH